MYLPLSLVCTLSSVTEQLLGPGEEMETRSCPVHTLLHRQQILLVKVETVLWSKPNHNVDFKLNR